MKSNPILKEIVVGSIMLILLFLFINPFHWVAIGEAFNIIAILSLIVFFIFAVIVCHRPSNDERDEYVLFLGERFGFITGCGILMVGLLYQSHYEQVDSWMAICFTAMMLAKIIGMIYAKLRY